MTIIGIDPSINSTGICIDKNGKTKYYIITSHMTKKMIKFDESNKDVNYLSYEKGEIINTSYSEKEVIKSLNIYNICKNIEIVLKKHKPNLVIMEGISYGSTGSAALVDLSGLLFAIRMLLILKNIPFKIVTPMHLKNFAVANGAADKEIMINAWKRLDMKMNKIIDVKIDDLADAFFLSQCVENQV